MKKLLFLMCLFPLVLSALKIDVSVNKYTLTTIDQLELTLKISDGRRLNVSEPQPPQVPLFTFRNVTSSSFNSTSLFRTKLSTEYTQSYTFIYIPQKPGKTTIPSFSVQVNNRDYATRAMDITIEKSVNQARGQSSPATPFRDPFGFAEPDYLSDRNFTGGNTLLLAMPAKQYVYRGFPAVVSYYLYTDEMVRSFNLDDEHDFSGYGKSTYEQPSMLNFENASMEGKSYKRTLIKRLALIPNQEGILQAPQLQGVARLYNFGYLNKSLLSSKCEINVRPLPDAKIPAGFNGAVGNFKLSHKLSEREIALGEALTLTLKIQGRGNFNQFLAPKFASGTGFQISSPMVVDNLQSGIEGTRTYYYTLIPQDKGELKLPELSFVWFGNDAGAFETYTLPPLVVTVKSARVLSYLNRLWEPRLPREMLPKISKNKYQPYVSVGRQPWYWLIVIIILVLVTIGALVALDKKLRQRDPKAYAQKKAEHILNKYMKQSTEAARNLSAEFYPLAEKALFTYLDAKYKLPNRLSNDDKISALRELNIPLHLVEEIQGFLQHCQAARFMPETDRILNLQEDLSLLRAIVGSFSRLRNNKMPELNK
ncbi:MAG: BatD family protein [Candidatus Cloacimonas sp.]|nr:BatD family protein [Candidatus Cloacimonas sp.]